MDRRQFLSLTASAAVLTQVPEAAAQSAGPDAELAAGWGAQPVEVYPGVWKFSFGTPERITPVSTRKYAPVASGLAALPRLAASPVTATGTETDRGFVVTLPLAPNELVYGLGLQFKSFIQRGLKKKIRVNADPEIDSGDSHAPAPFYLSTRGYGVLVDTARYATFYLGNKHRKGESPTIEESAQSSNNLTAQGALPSAYGRFRFHEPSEVMVEIPEAEGADVYVFGGPAMRQALQRYNLFSGGGALPPRWGLGVWYRCEGKFSQEEVLNLAVEFRARKMPMDVLGLEPGWQTHAYSCSFVWSAAFPDPKEMLDQLSQEHFRVNLWEHAFTHPTSPLHEPLKPLSGDYEVWDGLVPDFLTPEARRIFADFHEREHVTLGVSGYKLDECDNSDFTRNWSFPELSRFPSGADGEQMHCVFGQRYQDTIQGIFEKRGERTYGLVRSSGALAAPYPYALYSDLYDHATFIKAVPKAGLSGLLWTPEVRHAENHEDLIRRLQSAVLSPMALINAWYIKNPPWKQVDQAKNNAGEFDPEWERVEGITRSIFELRMRLVPYLHAAFVRYRNEGVPPFRPLVVDYPDDVQTWPLDDQYLIGESLLAAPVVAGQPKRMVYLPAGGWYDFWTGQRYEGGQRIEVAPPLEQVPLFVKAGTLLPLAFPAQHTDDPAGGQLTVNVYGSASGSTSLYEDDGRFDAPLNEVRLSWDAAGRKGSVQRSGSGSAPVYSVAEWKVIS